jgi:hypothetical protein
MAKNNQFSHSGEDFAKWRKAQILQTAPEEDQGQVQQQHIRHGAPSLSSLSGTMISPIQGTVKEGKSANVYSHCLT